MMSQKGGFDARLHNHYMRTRIRIGAQVRQYKDLSSFQLIIMILMNIFNDGGFQKKQEEEDERVRKEIKEYEQVSTPVLMGQ